MALSDHVTINITQDTVGVARAGFGIPLVLSALVTWPERVRSYQDLPSVAADGMPEGSPEYRAIENMFSQDLRPTRVLVGRAANIPTQRYELGLVATRNSYAYRVNVDGDGFDADELTYTSDASATVGEIALGLVAALNGVVGKNYTAAATGGVFPVVVTADAPGEWFSIEVVSVEDLSVAQTHADPGIAADLTAIQLENSDWYALHTHYNSEAMVLAAAAWVEANEKIYVFDTSDSASITSAAGGGDTLDELFTDGYTRTLGSYHPSPADFMSAALLGKVLPMDPGSESWKWKNLVGVSPVTLTSTHRQNLLSKNANSYQSIAGRGVTWEGQTPDGGFLDRIRGRDWVRDDMAKGIFEVLAAARKVPFTDAGIALIESPIRATLQRAVRMGIFAAGTPGDPTDPEPKVSVPKASDVPSGDRARRILPDIKWSAREAGAVHTVDSVDGTVSL